MGVVLNENRGQPQDHSSGAVHLVFELVFEFLPEAPSLGYAG